MSAFGRRYGLGLDFDERHAEIILAGDDGQITGAIATWSAVLRLVEAGTSVEGIRLLAQERIGALRLLLDPADR